jgi:uncharacterized protein YciI
VYVIALIRYRKPIDDVLKHVDAHRAYLATLKQKGWLVASGPLEPRSGGAALLRLPDGTPDADLLALRDRDPYVLAGVAQWELLPWNPGLGKESLDRA